jgi:SNF2 family DNA or RNA helicase
MKLIFIRRLAELMDNRECQREHLKELTASLGITMGIRAFKPLHNLTELQPHQIIAVNWMAEKENSLAKGGLLAEDCGTGKVRVCCALEIYCSPH